MCGDVNPGLHGLSAPVLDHNGAIVGVLSTAGRVVPALRAPRHPLALVNGWLTIDGVPLRGKQAETAWWLGRLLLS